MLLTSMVTALRSRQTDATSLSAEAYRLIREKIITLELAPASLVDESRLSEELGIGRTPIREALLRLQQENLIIILPRRGTLVTDIDARDLQKIYEIRMELEPYAVGLAAERATEAEITDMHAWAEEAAKTIRTGDSRALLTVDHQAHKLFASATHNEFLAEALDRLFGPMLRVSYWYATKRPLESLPAEVEEMRQIVLAIDARDGERARRLMRDHVAVFQQELLSMP